MEVRHLMNKLPRDVKGALLEKAPLLFLVSEKLYLDSVSIQNPNETEKKGKVVPV